MLVSKEEVTHARTIATTQHGGMCLNIGKNGPGIPIIMSGGRLNLVRKSHMLARAEETELEFELSKFSNGQHDFVCEKEL